MDNTDETCKPAERQHLAQLADQGVETLLKSCGRALPVTAKSVDVAAFQSSI